MYVLLSVVKKQKPRNMTGQKYMPEERRQDLSETDAII